MDNLWKDKVDSYISEKGNKSIKVYDGDSGVYIEYDENEKTIEIGGWYDCSCGVACAKIKLDDFKKALGM